MVQNLGNNTIMPVEPAIINNPNDKFVFKKEYSYTEPIAECAKHNPPCPSQPPRTFYFKTGQSIGEDMVKGMSIPLSVLSVNPSAASRGGAAATQSRDAWTGRVEWGKLFTFRNVFLVIFFMFLIYLFLKHMLPLIKKSVAK